MLPVQYEKVPQTDQNTLNLTFDSGGEHPNIGDKVLI